MADAQQYTFTQARARLEEIVTQVRRKDVSLEKSLDLLEEGVRLANACTELIDHTEWRAVVAEQEAAEAGAVADVDTEQAVDAAEGDESGAEVAEGDAALVDAEALDQQVAEDSDDFVDGAPELVEVGMAEVAVVEIDEDGLAHIDVTEVEFFAEADDAWPDDATVSDESDEAVEDEDEPSGV